MPSVQEEIERGRKVAEQRGIGQEKRDDETRITETERRMITGEEHPTQKQIRELSEKMLKQAIRIADDMQEHIDETERLMIEGSWTLEEKSRLPLQHIDFTVTGPVDFCVFGLLEQVTVGNLLEVIIPYSSTNRALSVTDSCGYTWTLTSSNSVESRWMARVDVALGPVDITVCWERPFEGRVTCAEVRGP